MNIVLISPQFPTFTSEYDRPYYACFVGRKRHPAHVHDQDEILSRYGDRIVHHEPITPVFTRAMGHYADILRSPELAHVREAVNYSLALRPHRLRD